MTGQMHHAATAGLRLIEIATAIDIDRDILPHMSFPPLTGDVRVMDAANVR